MHADGRKRVRAESGMESLIGCSLLLFLQVALVSPLQVVMNIGPKLLQLIAKGIQAHLRSPVRQIRRKTAIGLGIIEVGNPNRRRVAGKLGNVEHVPTGVFPSDENTVDGIAKAVDERTPAQSKIARIDFQD